MTVKVNSSDILHQGRVFKLIRENITLPNGEVSEFDILRHPSAALMVPLRGENVILIKQYRHAVAKYIWEAPAGTVEGKETPLECAKRELVEETGYSALSWQRLGEILTVPGYSDERLEIFLAKDLQTAKQSLDRDELIEVHELRFEKAMEMVHRGEITDSKTIVALFMVAHQAK